MADEQKSAEEIMCGLICIVPVLERALRLWNAGQDAELGKLLVVVNKIIVGHDKDVDAFWKAHAKAQALLLAEGTTEPLKGR